MENKIKEIKRSAFEEIANAKTSEELFELKIKYLGRKSEFNSILKGLKDLSGEERKTIGQLANSVKGEISGLIEETERLLVVKSFDPEKEKIDVTIPGRKMKKGHLHPLSIVRNEIEDIFTAMGFEIADGPEVETEYYNFDALNMPKDHPARDKWDTFWVKGEEGQKERTLLRTHTSPVQVRFMEKNKPPFRIISPGKCFRNEATDARHEHTFYQFEALVVGDDINVGHFKFLAQQFFSSFFKKEIDVRVRPSFFPFVEPGFEFDITCTVCGQKGCPVCKGTGWLEVGGAGMVNQEVFVASGYPRGKYQGFAWGFGLERLLIIRHKIDDIRNFHSGDLRFIKQF
ncbi:MAG TPA: phenylalanine--tRNA ligase subunit alpha [Candidatus Moranbacteria bacterium]|nr:MAG: Phenylalanine-tRNA ligase alpha subunit [Candidatus Moranbacteria bacterium GW2011_GWC2_45_10]KKT92687.1 MAG: phenylalanyl-tRNA synthetase subunit alpha, phenylalanyl-tRNA synthetase alpha chain [Parcubacteria group bacterium GW2011_GWC1_45_14]HAV11546.1 phenylalanine--tRNA ligase subunit alpha [Candidatus Moranbacteria bacterium]